MMQTATWGPQAGGLSALDDLYGSDFGAVPGAVAASPAAPSTASPHDKRDKGPPFTEWFENPTVWLALAFAVGAGIIGFRFHWGPGAKVSGSVDVTDELSGALGHVFLAIAGIATFKLIASKVKIKALQEFAAFL